MISVIIPTLNEEAQIEDCIRNILAEEADCEIIVADGGSSDMTVLRAEECKRVKVVTSARGRGPQMNLGAFSARGDILLFLHADTRLEKGWSHAASAALGDETVAGGAFTFRIDGAGKQFRLIELWVKLRCCIFGLPYGDQGIFVRRDVFRSVGGYRNIPLMEDVDLVRKMKKLGRVAVLPGRAFTSARRWAERGWIRASLLNNVIMFLFRIGVDPDRLARLYYGEP